MVRIPAVCDSRKWLENLTLSSTSSDDFDFDFSFCFPGLVAWLAVLMLTISMICIADEGVVT